MRVGGDSSRRERGRAGLVAASSIVFLHIDRGFNRIWDVRLRQQDTGFLAALKRLVLSRLRSLAMLFGTGLVVVLVFTTGLALRATNAIVREWFPASAKLPGSHTALIGLVINALVFFLLYRFLSKERVSSRLCLFVALGSATLWEIGGQITRSLSFDAGFSVYGVIGSFLLVQVWIYFNAMVLFAGAVVVRVLTKPLDDAAMEGG